MKLLPILFKIRSEHKSRNYYALFSCFFLLSLKKNKNGSSRDKPPNDKLLQCYKCVLEAIENMKAANITWTKKIEELSSEECASLASQLDPLIAELTMVQC
jgi:hypothetical protein